MATSGNTSYNLTTSQIITTALQLVGVIGPNETVEGEDYLACLNILNMMVKAWEAKGIYVFTETEGTIFLNNNQYSYTIGGSNPDKASTGSSEVETALTASYTSPATQFGVNSTNNISVNDNIGICLDDNTIYWSTVSSIDSPVLLTIAGALTGDATAGNMVYTYTNQMGKPLLINSVRIRKAGGTDQTLQSQQSDFIVYGLSRDSYFSIPNKGIPGTPVQFYADIQKDYTTIYTYPANSSVTYRLKISYRRIIQDFTDPTNTADFPQEWMAPLSYNLAVWIAPIYGKEMKVSNPNAMGANIRDLAGQMLNDALNNSQEKMTFKLMPKIAYDI